MIKFLQTNLYHCWAAQQLLQQMIKELEIDVVLISEQHGNPGDSDNWVHSDNRRCALLVANPAMQITESGSGAGFVWARIEGTIIISCYFSPNSSLAEYEELIGQLGDLIRSGGGSPMVIGGDFNAHSAKWRCPFDDRRGHLLSELAAEQDCTICNLGNTPTYRRYNTASIVDVTLARLEPGMTIQDWRVRTDMNSESDHFYISYTLHRPGRNPSRQRLELPEWSIRKLDTQKLAQLTMAAPRELQEGDHLEDSAEQFERVLISHSIASS